MRKRHQERELYHIRTVLRPPPDLSARFDAIIDRAIAAGPNTKIDYQLDSAKANFLNYVCDWRGLVAHGSPLPDLVKLVPTHNSDRDVNEFGRRDLTFASPDALWAMWFALLPLPPGRSTANGCRRIDDALGVTKKSYFFAVPADQVTSVEAPPQGGTVYLCRREEFQEKNGEEWGSPLPVIPVAQIRVEPVDFPFKHGIFGFRRQRMQEITSRCGMQGFPWLHDADLYPVRPARILIDGVIQ